MQHAFIDIKAVTPEEATILVTRIETTLVYLTPTEYVTQYTTIRYLLLLWISTRLIVREASIPQLP